MKISQFIFVSLVAVSIITFPGSVAVAADGYNAAFRTCQTAIAERFGADESLTVSRKSFSKQGRSYKVLYVVNQSLDDSSSSQRHVVRCKTTSKGELKSLEVTAD